MDEFYFSSSIGNSKTLCVGPISESEAANADSPFCDGLGFYLYVVDEAKPTNDVEVLGKLVSDTAAEQLSRLLSKSR